MYEKILFFRPAYILAAMVAFSGALGSDLVRAEDIVYESKLTSIHYQNLTQLEIFQSKMQQDALTRTLDSIFLGRPKAASGKKLGRLVDRLFQRVQLILDMPQPKLRVHVKLLENQKRLSDVHTRMTGKPTKFIAFYRRERNTIYLQTENLTIGILAHEMAHAVVDHYFIVRPPAKIAELLCQYVDRKITTGYF